MTIFEALRESHDIQRRLCRALTAARRKDADRAAAFLELKVELEAHAAAEERFFYVPLLMKDQGLSASRHALGEHHEIEELCDELSVQDKATEAWRDKAKELGEKVRHHLKEEERKFFQLAGKLLSESNKLSLSKRYVRDLVRMRRHYAVAYASVDVVADGSVRARPAVQRRQDAASR